MKIISLFQNFRRIHYIMAMGYAEISIKQLKMNSQNQPDHINYDPEMEMSQTNHTQHAEGDSDDQYIDECNFQFTNFQRSTNLRVGKYDPKYEHLVVVPGLNLKGKCTSPQCKPVNKNVWIRLGYGTFDIGKTKHKSICPCCKQKINPRTILTLGYRKAEIRIEGVKVEGDQDIYFQFQDIEDKGLFRYYHEFDQNKTTWEYLEVTASPLKKLIICPYRCYQCSKRFLKRPAVQSQLRYRILQKRKLLNQLRFQIFSFASR